MSLCKKYCKKIISPIVCIYSYRMVKSELPLKKFWNFKLKTIKIRKLFFWEVFIKFFMVLFSFSLPCDILPPPTLRLEVGASRVIPSHDGKLTERSPCAPRFEGKLDDRQSFHALMFDIDGRIDVPVALESTFTAECPFRKR